MKILFLHLSDAHFKETTDFREINIDAMIKAIGQVGEFDECIMVFSGDISYSGSEKEFIIASRFIGNLLGRVSNRFLNHKTIKTIIVPGNHDNNVKNVNRNRQELESYYNKNTDERIIDDLVQLNNFYEFARKNQCYYQHKTIETKVVKFGKFVIKFNLINSAPFSLLGGINEDKGLHYIPNVEMIQLDRDFHENYTVTVMHHGPEWFSDDSRLNLYKKLNESTDLLFVGHEHFSQSENKSVNGNHIDISSGVALWGTKTEQGFNTLILDTETRILSGEKFILNNGLYKQTSNLKDTKVIFHNKCKFTFTQQFQKEINEDINERAGEYYSDYYVFPTLESKSINSDSKNYKITNIERFNTIFASKHIISIEGGSKSGKSLLAKYLCNYYSQDYVPIYITSQNFQQKRIDRIIKYALQNQFGDDVDMDVFNQLDVEKKVLIIDGYDKVKKETWTIFYAQNQSLFGHIILLRDIDWNMNIKEKTVEKLTGNKVFYMAICPFYYIKREELVRKICTKYKLEQPLLDVDDKSKKINNGITDQIKYFSLTPDFIHQFVDYYIAFPQSTTQKNTNIFSKVFESNIVIKLSKNIHDESDVDEIMVALDFVAYYINHKKEYPLSYVGFENAVNDYKDKYDYCYTKSGHGMVEKNTLMVRCR